MLILQLSILLILFMTTEKNVNSHLKESKEQVLASMNCTGGATNDQKPAKSTMSKFLPKNIKGWKFSKKAKFFKGEEIYDYINGAGEIYRSYNYNSVLVQRYINKNNQEILVEIFDMLTSANAFGVFSHTRGIYSYGNNEIKDPGIGKSSVYIPGLLCFWKDKYFVCIRVERETPKLRETVFEIGRSIAGKITSDGQEPEIINYLPLDEIIQESIRYLFNYEILNQHFYVADKNILNLNAQTPAVLAQYKDDKSYILLMNYPDDDISKKSFENFMSAYLPDVENTNILRTENGKWTGAIKEKNFIVVIFDAIDSNSIEKKLSTLSRRLKQ